MALSGLVTSGFDTSGSFLYYSSTLRDQCVGKRKSEYRIRKGVYKTLLILVKQLNKYLLKNKERDTETKEQM